MKDEEFLRLAIEHPPWRPSAANTRTARRWFETGMLFCSDATRRGTRETLPGTPEMLVIRDCSCEPCGMCIGAIYWAGLRKPVYACPTEVDARISQMPFAVPLRSLMDFPGGHPFEIAGPLFRALVPKGGEGYLEQF